MTVKHITAILLALAAMIGYNAFLIKRDDAMFSAYYKDKACEQVKAWHPDCKK